MTHPVERRAVHYAGNVQGVGFRYTAKSIAERFDVTGYVRNLRDRRVELIVEGEAAELDRFLAAVQQRMAGHLRDIEVSCEPATSQFTGFEIRF